MSAAVRVRHLAGEDRDRRAVGPGVVERDGVLALGEDRPGDAGREGHRRMLDGAAAGIRVGGMRRPASRSADRTGTGPGAPAYDPS